jgi:hypothetical protein
MWEEGSLWQWVNRGVRGEDEGHQFTCEEHPRLGRVLPQVLAQLEKEAEREGEVVDSGSCLSCHVGDMTR